MAYETVQLPNGELPLLTPMSEVAGRMAVQAGAKYLEKVHGGRGILLGGVPGVPPAEVVILGGGVVGLNAAKIAAGLGAHVTILDISLPRLRYLSDVLPANVDTVYSNRHNILEAVTGAELVIGAVLLPGARAPHLVKRDDLKLMKQGAVIVDVAVDQGGCVETIKPTTHENPTYFVEGILHYGVANMPGGVPRTSTLALTNATLPVRTPAGPRRVEDGVQERSRAPEGAQRGRGQGGVSRGGRGVQAAAGGRCERRLTPRWRSASPGSPTAKDSRCRAAPRRGPPATISRAPRTAPSGPASAASSAPASPSRFPTATNASFVRAPGSRSGTA